MTARRREVASRHDQEFSHAAIPPNKPEGLEPVPPCLEVRSREAI